MCDNRPTATPIRKSKKTNNTTLLAVFDGSPAIKTEPATKFMITIVNAR